jgi:Alpha-kinase family
MCTKYLSFLCQGGF